MHACSGCVVLLRNHPTGDHAGLGDPCLSVDPLLVEVDGVDELVELVVVPVFEVGELLIVRVAEVLGVGLENGVLVRSPTPRVPGARRRGRTPPLQV